jgi:hypothetical protein
MPVKEIFSEVRETSQLRKYSVKLEREESVKEIFNEVRQRRLIKEIFSEVSERRVS